MAKFIFRRIWQAIIVLFIVTIMVFTVMHIIPGDPIQIFLGETSTPEQIAYYTKEFGLDQPLTVQYVKWVSGLLHGEMGRSVMYSQDVRNILPKRILVTLSVTLPALILATICGVLLGVAAATHRGKKLDSIILALANIGIATPTFWIGILLVYFFGLMLHVLPIQGYTSLTENLALGIKKLILPVFVLSLGQLAGLTRQTRSAMLEVISQDYIRTAKSKGLKSRTIVYRHALRNALIPIITLLGNSIGGMIGGTVIIESLFVIPGVGSLMMSAIINKDYMVVQNVVFIISFFVVVCNLLVDILYGYLDPRIRVSK